MVMLDRWVYFGRRRMSRRFPELLRLCQQGELPQAARLAEGDAMEAEVVRVAASVSAGGQEAVEKAVASTIDRRRLEYEQWLFVLGTLGNNAPFIGLFGTVLGIIRAFADLATNTGRAGGGSNPSAVMAGISEALVATAVGLTRQGRLFLNGVETDDAGLLRTVQEVRSKGEDVQAIIGADKSATHGAVTHVLDVLKGAGVVKFAIQIEAEK